MTGKYREFHDFRADFGAYLIWKPVRLLRYLREFPRDRIREFRERIREPKFPVPFPNSELLPALESPIEPAYSPAGYRPS